MQIDPATRGGMYTLEQALDIGLLEGAKAYRSTGRPRSWYLLYDGNRIGRAIVECYGFELLVMGVPHRFTFFQEVNERSETIELMPKRPPKWSIR